MNPYDTETGTNYQYILFNKHGKSWSSSDELFIKPSMNEIVDKCKELGYKYFEIIEIKYTTNRYCIEEEVE